MTGRKLHFSRAIRAWVLFVMFHEQSNFVYYFLVGENYMAAQLRRIRLGGLFILFVYTTCVECSSSSCGATDLYTPGSVESPNYSIF